MKTKAKWLPRMRMSAQPFTFYNTIHLVDISPTQQAWNIWKQRLGIRFSEINCQEEKVIKDVLFKCIGSAAYSILHSVCSS